MATDKKMKIVKKIALPIIFISLVIFLGGTVLFNRSQPSKIETSEAIILVESLQKYVLNDHQKIFSAASHNTITIDAYGYLSEKEQEEILNSIKTTLEKKPFNGKIFIKFFPKREYMTVQKNGLIISELIKMDFIRAIELNNIREKQNAR